MRPINSVKSHDGTDRQGVRLVDPDLVARFQARYPHPLDATVRMLLTGCDPEPP